MLCRLDSCSEVATAMVQARGSRPRSLPASTIAWALASCSASGVNVFCVPLIATGCSSASDGALPSGLATGAVACCTTCSAAGVAVVVAGCSSPDMAVAVTPPIPARANAPPVMMLCRRVSLRMINKSLRRVSGTPGPRTHNPCPGLRGASRCVTTIGARGAGVLPGPCRVHRV